MSLESKRRIDALIDAANAKTGGSDTTLTSAVQTLCDGFGIGGGSVERTAWYRPPDWPDITSLPFDESLSATLTQAYITVDKSLTDGTVVIGSGGNYNGYIELGKIEDGQFVAIQRYSNTAFNQSHTVDLTLTDDDFPVLFVYAGKENDNQWTSASHIVASPSSPIVEIYASRQLKGGNLTSNGYIKAITVAPTSDVSLTLAGLSSRPIPQGAEVIDWSRFSSVTASSRALYCICQNRYSLKEFKFPSVAQNSVLLDTTSQSHWPSCAFQNCYALRELDMSIFDTAEVSDISQMFDYCYSLRTLNISGWNLAACTKVSSTFRGCTSLVNLITDGVTLPSVAISFSDCTALSVDSLNGIIAALPTLEDGTALTLTLGSTNTAKLTEAEIAVATEKGWTVA